MDGYCADTSDTWTILPQNPEKIQLMSHFHCKKVQKLSQATFPLTVNVSMETILSPNRTENAHTKNSHCRLS